MVYYKCDTSTKNQNNTQDSQNRFFLAQLSKRKRIVIRSILENISYNIQVCILNFNKCHIFLNSNACVRNKRH